MSSVQRSEHSSEYSEEEDVDEYDKEFVVNDDEEYSEESNHKQKKDRKNQKRKIKQEQFAEGDIEVLEEDKRSRLNRLKRMKESDEEKMEEQEELPGQDFEDESGQPIAYHSQINSEQNWSSMDELQKVQMDIFQPGDLRKLRVEDEEKQLVQIDLPQRKIMRLRQAAKTSKKSLQDVAKEWQMEDRQEQAQWIYQKLRQEGRFQTAYQGLFCQRIRLILQAIHKEHCQIAYIITYRKKIYADLMQSSVLWRIAQLDEEWQSFRSKHATIHKKLVEVIKSYQNVPKEIQTMLSRCYDLKTLRYFEDYQRFALAKLANSTNLTRKEAQLSFVSQVYDRKVPEQLDRGQFMLSPQNLCHNLKARTQQIKPRTPTIQPKDFFQQILRSSNPQYEKTKYPLLTSDVRFQTISRYLSLQLFSYPQLRSILKEKYYKKLTLSTMPTKKGTQDIDLYSIYFPVKRIKDKHVSTLKREVWILALQAQKHELIKIDLKFDWESAFDQNRDKNQQRDLRDSIYMEIIKYYFDISSHKSSSDWNIFRKRVIYRMLQTYFLPAFFKEVREQLTSEGQKEVIQGACAKFKAHLNKGPSLKEDKPIKILAIVYQQPKLGMAFVNQHNEVIVTHEQRLQTDDEIKNFVNDQRLLSCIRDNKPDMILVAANCRRAQTLRKELRNPQLFAESIYCAFGQYEVPRLVAKKQFLEGQTQAQLVLAAISMARYKRNPMAQVLSLWNPKVQANGVLSLNLHFMQSFIDQRRLKEALNRVAIEMVNAVGVDITQLEENQRAHCLLQFISGLGPKKAFTLSERLRSEVSDVTTRKKIAAFVSGKIVYKNCGPFFKIDTSAHQSLFDKNEKDKRKNIEGLTLLDMTRIPEEWYAGINRRLLELAKANTLADIRKSNGPDPTVSLIQLMKLPQKNRTIDWKCKDIPYFDEDLVRNQLTHPFKSPRDNQQIMDNKQIFYSLLGQTPQSLKRYTILSVKVLSFKNNYLNVVIPENGLLGSIKVPFAKQQQAKLYQKGRSIKAILLGFPFDERKFRQQSEAQQQLLKVEMSFDFPHKDKADEKHDCLNICFPSILKEIHPLIDTQRQHFQLKKSDIPVLQTTEQLHTKTTRIEHRRIAHPKYKNIAAGPAVQFIKNEPIGDFVLRPSSQGSQFLIITWNFFTGVVAHIKVRSEQKMGMTGYTFRIEDKDAKVFNSIEEIIEKFIKPMNKFVQDVISNKKFIYSSLQNIEDKIKSEVSKDSSQIYYYFGCSQECPLYFVLLYMYKDKKPIKELIKVRCTGLYFHDQQFQSIRELIAWFKEHLKQKEYQKYAKTYAFRK